MSRNKDNMRENFMALDLEMNQPSQTIIQIGVSVGNIFTGEVLETKHWNIVTTEEIRQDIINLTGITQEMVNEGVFLDEAYAEVVAMHKKYDAFTNPITWGGGDSQELAKQLYEHIELNNLEKPKWVLGRRWIDVKTLYVSLAIANQRVFSGGLKVSMGKVGLKFEGDAHRADTDALNTFKMYKFLLDKLPTKDLFL